MRAGGCGLSVVLVVAGGVGAVVLMFVRGMPEQKAGGYPTYEEEDKQNREPEFDDEGACVHGRGCLLRCLFRKGMMCRA